MNDSIFPRRAVGNLKQDIISVLCYCESLRRLAVERMLRADLTLEFANQPIRRIRRLPRTEQVKFAFHATILRLQAIEREVGLSDNGPARTGTTAATFR